MKVAWVLLAAVAAAALQTTLALWFPTGAVDLVLVVVVYAALTSGSVTGLVTGSAMLDREDLTSETRERLWCSLRGELDRMERMLAGQGTQADDLRLDDALTRILDLQRLKGRHVELHCTGDVVHAPFDDLAEVLNILVDNAAKHGGTDESVVEVSRRDDEMVDITVTDFGRGIPREQRPQIFEWGKRGARSQGEGIGLNVAQRLMTEAGGSLRLAERDGAGSSFVISLPAARRPHGDDLGPDRPAAPELTMEDRRDRRVAG